MRPHLLECIKKGKFTPFQSECVRRSRSVTNEKVEIHCDCRLPESVSKEMMAYSPKCSRWYHQSCQSIPDRIFDLTIEMTGFVVIAMSLCKKN